MRYFKYIDFDFNVKNIFYEIFTSCLGQINPKIKIAQKFVFDISSILVLITISDKSFIEHLPEVMPKLVPEFEFQCRL